MAGALQESEGNGRGAEPEDRAGRGGRCRGVPERAAGIDLHVAVSRGAAEPRKRRDLRNSKRANKKSRGEEQTEKTQLLKTFSLRRIIITYYMQYYC